MIKAAVTVALAGLLLISCAAKNLAGEVKCFRKKKMLIKAYQMGKMTDEYVKLRKGNYFEYYGRIMGLTKFKNYNGSYQMSNDTLYLNFCNNVIPENLSGVALFQRENKEITLLGVHPKYDERFIVRIDKTDNQRDH